jgi:ABC-2 type transport system ATP-binding protein
MQVRLAFSIAIKAQGDILVLDEVLAVGDEAFQRKCFEYFRRLKEDKKTVILVTHDMYSAKKFCNKLIMIDSGNIVASGNPEEVANLYTMKNLQNTNYTKTKATRKEDSDSYPWIRIELHSKEVLSSKDKLKMRVVYFSPENVPVTFGISLIDEATDGTVSVIDDGILYKDGRMKTASNKSGQYCFDYEIGLDGLNSRNFKITASLFKYDNSRESFVPYAFIEKEDIVRFAIRESGLDGGLLKRKGNWSKVD